MQAYHFNHKILFHDIIFKMYNNKYLECVMRKKCKRNNFLVFIEKEKQC